MMKLSRSPQIPLLLLLLLFFSVYCDEKDDDKKGHNNDYKSGSINDIFTDPESSYESDLYGKLKDRIDVRLSDKHWIKLNKHLRKQLDKIKEAGGEFIPEIDYSRIRHNGGKFPDKFAEKVKKRGVVIVRNTIPPEEAQDYLSNLIKYMYRNEALPENLKETNRTVYEIYWSKSQIKARQHPQMIETQKALLKLFRVENEGETDVDLNSPKMYVDRLRIRPPGDRGFYIPPHVDGGGIERWMDETYRKVYRRILEGNYEAYDPYEVDYRVEANMNENGHSNGCTFFRAFQGWLSLSQSGPGSGTLRILPNLKEATAYWILRPFLKDVPRDLFPGAFPGKSFHITKKWHSLLEESLISLPPVNPGDTVWWHADLIHSVEPVHSGEEFNTVFYIPAGPECRINRDYLRKLRHAFLLGETPPDFPKNDVEVGFKDLATLKDLSQEGKDLMGWETTPSPLKEAYWNIKNYDVRGGNSFNPNFCPVN